MNWPITIYVVAVKDNVGDEFFTSRAEALEHIIAADLEEDARILVYHRDTQIPRSP